MATVIKTLTEKKINSLDRSKLMDYCTTNKIAFNAKDSSDRLRLKILQFNKLHKSNRSATYRGFGQNVIVVIDGDKLSKKVPVKSDREAIKALVETYNKKLYKKTKVEIYGYFSIEGKKTSKVKTKKNKITKQTSPELEAAQKRILELENENRALKSTSAKTTTRRGEY